MKPKPVKPRRRRAWVLLAAVVLVGCGVVGWRAIGHHREAADSIPARPSATATWPGELADRVAAAEERARGWWNPIAGVTELGRLYHANGFYNEALQCYDGLQRIDSTDPRWPHLAASILAGFGQFENALPLCQRAVALAPKYLPARLRLGDVLLKGGRNADAATAYTAALEQEPDNPYALLGLARCDIAKNDWSAAREKLRRAVDKHPDNIGVLSLLVAVSDHLGDSAAASELRGIIRRREFADFPDPWVDGLIEDCYDPYRLSVAAAVAHLGGDMPSAQRWLERAIALAPKTSAYRRQLGKMQFLARDYPAAQRQLEQAVAVAPTDADAWALLVETLTALGDDAAVQRTLASGLANCPESAALHLANGHRLGNGGRFPEAIAELTLAKKLHPSEAEAYLDLAKIYFQQERIDDAIAELRAALVVQPGHPLAMEIMARHSIGTGDEVAARHWIRQLRQSAKVPVDDLRTIEGEYQQQFGHAPN